jgi:hypothetical protein
VGLLGSITSFGKKLWDGVKGVWHGFGGFFSILTNFLKNLISHLALLWEIPLIYFFNKMTPKKLRLRVVILNNENGNSLADRNPVEGAVAIAQSVFKRELNVTIEGVAGQDITRDSAEPSPSYVLEPTCSTGASDIHTQVGSIFSRSGAWYRSRVARSPTGTFFGYGTPVTFFVVRDVPGKRGCANLAWYENYGWIDPSALPPTWIPTGDPDEVRPYDDVDHSTLPHEIGHCCDLLTHRKQKENLMHSSQTTRTGTSFTKWQKVVVRTCTHVTSL